MTCPILTLTSWVAVSVVVLVDVSLKPTTGETMLAMFRIGSESGWWGNGWLAAASWLLGVAGMMRRSGPTIGG